MTQDAMAALRQMQRQYPKAYDNMIECTNSAKAFSPRTSPRAFAFSRQLLGEHGITQIAYQAIGVLQQLEVKKESMRQKLHNLDMSTLFQVTRQAHHPNETQNYPIHEGAMSELHTNDIVGSSRTLTRKALETIRSITRLEAHGAHIT